MNRWTHWIALMFLSSQGIVIAGATEVDPLFAAHSTLEVTLEAPLQELMRERDESSELPGKLRYVEAGGTPVELDVLVRTRGKYRARPKVCRFAPLRLNFRKSQVADTVFAGQDKLKLVTHCKPRSREYEQAVVAEYLAYRVLNILTDVSYRARLLRIRYVDTDVDSETTTYGVLIEADERLGRRLDHDLAAVPELDVEDLDSEYTNLTSVFQFLIGNTDFSPVAGPDNEDCCHNHTPVTANGEVFYSIPYDFDQCGFVDAPHAAPNERFRLRSVKQRLYRGRCVNNDRLPATLDRYRERRGDIEALVANQPELAARTRRQISKYVASFYKVIDDPKRVQKVLVRECI